jgi:hypothetical protein
MLRDLFRRVSDLRLMDVTTGQHLAVLLGSRHRAVQPKSLVPRAGLEPAHVCLQFCRF